MRETLTPDNIVRHEFIGLQVSVKESSDPKKEGIKGKVFDETKKTLKIDTGQKEVTIPKEESKFVFELPEDGKIKINGKVILGRPEERIKKKFPKKWETLE